MRRGNSGMFLANKRSKQHVTVKSTGAHDAALRKTSEGRSIMNGLDQIIITIWFLPVVLFIVMPLCIGAVWLPISLMIKLVRRETYGLRYAESAPE